MIYKKHTNGSYNIHTIKTDRFNNIQIEVVFRNNIDLDTIVSKTIMFDLLTDTTNTYKTKRELNLKLESLYNALLYSKTNRVGNISVNSIVIDFLNPKFMDEDVLEDEIKLLFDCIFNPHVSNNEFSSIDLENVKKRVIDSKMNELENSSTVAYLNAYKNLDKDSLIFHRLTGNIDDVKSVTPSSVYKAYEYMIKHDYIDIFVIGDIEENKIINLIDKYALFNTIKNHELIIDTSVKTRSVLKKVYDKSHFQQANLIKIYNILNLTDYESKYVFNVYNEILGGSSLESRLNKKLRNDNSLCYGIYSTYLKYDNLFIIHTMLDNNNIDLSIKLINTEVKRMNELENDEIQTAISLILSSLNMIYDDPQSIIREYLFNNYFNLDDLNKRIINYRKVSIEDIKKINKKIKANLLYILGSDK